MKKEEIMKNVSTTFSKVSVKLKKHSPEILVVAGVIGTVASAVMACHATTKLDSVLEKSKKDIDAIHKCAENEELAAEYSKDDAKKDLTIVYVQAGVKVAKLYAPAVALGTLSIASIVASHNILKKRNVALAAAYATVDKTFKEYRKYIEKDSALERRFQPVTVNEPTVDETIEVLNGIAKYYESYHRVHISPEMIRLCAVLSERYITDRFLPDKAIDLVDEACAMIRTEMDSMPTELDEIRRKIMQHEIEEAALQKGEDEALEDDYKRLANGKEILESVLEAHQLCASDGASEAIGRALRSLASVSEYDSDLKALYNQLMDVDSLLNDFNREISGYADELDVDEETLKKTEERLDLINHLKTKYGDTIEKIQAYCEEKKQRFAVLENYEGYLAERKSRFAACKKQLQKEAENLTVIRKEAAQRFTEQVKQALMDLNFLDVQFELDFRLLEDYMVSGQDEVCFMISTNPGQPLRPVQDTASGGELSRIMLAVKSVMADQEKVETLIFDEIDSGISGRTAQMVSEKLALIAGNHQVICITHLPQIAAMADSHFEIEKHLQGTETITQIHVLKEHDSIRELARLLGGAEITPAVLENAKEMKELAQKQKNTRFK